MVGRHILFLQKLSYSLCSFVCNCVVSLLLVTTTLNHLWRYLLKVQGGWKTYICTETELFFMQFCLQSCLVSLLSVTTTLNHLWRYLFKAQGGWKTYIFTETELFFMPFCLQLCCFFAFSNNNFKSSMAIST